MEGSTRVVQGAGPRRHSRLRDRGGRRRSPARGPPACWRARTAPSSGSGSGASSAARSTSSSSSAPSCCSFPRSRREGELGSAGWFWIGRGRSTASGVPGSVIGLTLILVAVIPPGERLRVPVAAGDRLHLTLMQMAAPLFDAGIRIGFGINGPLWLISIVVTFYAVLPLIARPFYRHPFAGLAIAAAVTVVWKELVGARAGRARRPDGSVGGVRTNHRRRPVPGLGLLVRASECSVLGRTSDFVRITSPERLARTAVLALPALVLVYASPPMCAAGTRSTSRATWPSSLAANRSRRCSTQLREAALIGAVVLGPAWMQPAVREPTDRAARGAELRRLPDPLRGDHLRSEIDRATFRTARSRTSPSGQQSSFRHRSCSPGSRAASSSYRSSPGSAAVNQG